MKKIRILYHYIFTYVIYKPFFLKSGKRIIICKPILITPKYLKLGSRIFIRDFARLEAITKYEGIFFNPIIEIGDGVSIEQNLHLTCAKRISVGKDTAIASNVTITDINHPYENVLLPPEKQRLEVAEVIIGEGCKIYNNAVILAGTILGKHNVVAANAVVSGIYSDYCIIAGNPARIIRKYDVVLQRWI